jgi:hypothetical protein
MNMRINREHKDRLFNFIFKEKENLLQLYNALNGTTYNNPEELEIVTLEDVIYMRMKNDISFVLDYEMNLFEHQSTSNSNMPLRGLLYFARQYEKYVAENEYNIFGSKLIPIPTPQYVVFYNGNSWKEERKILKLSDSFASNRIGGCIELEVIQLNINYGHNKEIMEKCKPLWEYSVFIGKIKTYNKSMTIENAVDKAAKKCIEQGILKEILMKHQAEVKDMILTEYDEEKTMRLFRKEFEEDAAEKVRKATEEAEKRADERIAKAEKKVSDAEKKANDAEKKATDAEKKATDAEKKANDAEKKATDAEKKANDAEKKLIDAEEKYKKLQAEMKKMKKKFEMLDGK